MKIRLFSIVSLIVASLIINQLTGNQVHSSSSGAPAGNTGSPFDAKTCARSGCHVGTATASIFPLITSNIPTTGYVPGQTYTITASMTSTIGGNKFGFQISPQQAGGNLCGMPIITNTTTTKIVSSKYITHTAAGNAGVGGSKTWTFNWVAPMAGTGSLNFYGAFNYANGNNMASGDIIETYVLAVDEDLTVGISDIPQELDASFFPNPVIDHATIRINLAERNIVRVLILDASGKRMQNELMVNGVPGTQDIQLPVSAEWPAGIYKAIITIDHRQAVRNFIKQ